MTIIQHPATHSTTEAPSNVGSAMAELLTQVPAQLAEQIRDAWSADLQFMFTTGMDAGERIVFDAFEKAGIEPAKKIAAPSRPTFRVLLGGAR
ncbi:hypothetical protein [Mycobacterium sp.]|uniref:hypothetical protein n=1 Tax=Mycobacterium sp. TaxID=1785 RepID=UPI0026151297|nr:hypothetical protein [Mycobacterium sp.]